jgi:hypothetical protein
MLRRQFAEQTFISIDKQWAEHSRSPEENITIFWWKSAQSNLKKVQC